MEEVVRNLTAWLYPPKEKPWLEPYDSITRMSYYLFENNKRLRYVYVALDDYHNKGMKEDDLDLLMYMIQYPNEQTKKALRQNNVMLNMTVPVAESCLRLFTAKNETVQVESPGLFDEILKMPVQVWIGVAAVFGLLTTIEIVEKRMAGIRRTVISCAYDNLFQQFGAILGKGYYICRLPAIRLATGPWILQIVVLFTLLCAVITANFSTKHRRNIDSVKDLARASSYLRIWSDGHDESEICKSNIEEMQMACNYTKTAKKQALMGYLPNDYLVYFKTIFNMVTNYEHGHPIFEKGAYMSSSGYHCQPLIYFVGRKINPTALKLVNDRLRSFVETSHVTPWHRHLEKQYGLDTRAKPRSPGGNKFRAIEWKDVEMAFAVWATQLALASLVAAIELIKGF